MMRFVAFWVLLLVSALPVAAQGPARLHAELPSAEQPARNGPTTGYTLAISWAPEYCHGARGQRAADPECRPAVQRAGFVLHGLWPDGAGQDGWPQYCHPVAILTDAQVSAGLAATPSPQLLQHEWAKHGSCMGSDPVQYFSEEARLYRKIVLPPLAQLARRDGLTAGDIAGAFARANPSLPVGAIRVHANRKGWLEEIWLCLDRNRRFDRCDASQGGGTDAGTPVRIETAYSRTQPRARPIARP